MILLGSTARGRALSLLVLFVHSLQDEAFTWPEFVLAAWRSPHAEHRHEASGVEGNKQLFDFLVDVDYTSGGKQLEDVPHVVGERVKPLDFSAGVVLHLGHGEESHWKNGPLVPQSKN